MKNKYAKKGGGGKEAGKRAGREARREGESTAPMRMGQYVKQKHSEDTPEAFGAFGAETAAWNLGDGFSAAWNLGGSLFCN